MSDIIAYAGLFGGAFAAATILPFSSEAALVVLLLAGYSPVWLLLVAGAGNVLGSAVNWLLGRFIERYRDRKWFPVSDRALARAQGWYHRYGRWSLLLSWVPVIGDPLTLVAGVMREPFTTFLLLVTIAKVGRYVALTLLTLGWS
jgi:membrane protein YqaA with SNARE-associated domain